jgi:hypothetical protein
MIKPTVDFYAQGFRYVQTQDVFPGDDYLISYVEQVIMNTCWYRDDLHNGYIDLDGKYWKTDAGMWVRKHS